MKLLKTIYAVDKFLFGKVNGLARKSLAWRKFFIFCARYLEIFFLAGVFFVALSEKKIRNKLVFNLFFAGAFSRGILVPLFRFLIERPRPFIAGEGIRFIPLFRNFGFPSGHASFYSSLAFVLLLFLGKKTLPFVLGSFLISLGRVGVGVHWPLDVLVGWVVGIIAAVTSNLTSFQLVHWLEKRGTSM